MDEMKAIKTAFSHDLCNNDYPISLTFSDIKWLITKVEQQQKELADAHNKELSYIDDIETYQLQETLLLERLKKVTLEYKELKRNSRSIRFFEMAEENLKLATELAQMKGEISG
ncbi:hypothetical protein J1P26_07305 [Neobacillus sp. MM2021_6]|uniref:hypothetical protein n=1 Tax=Bacillaceae TaxID=186817 RepID=UPI00140B0E8E|nr:MULTISPECIES: hypothetical protein [Bacillaceae]MBO0959539.1 hypothetical protein [Neobacillus sp. MM2021_6]NHC17163.1 hypothetical protein [Bacillus sp. MM2020_4]